MRIAVMACVALCFGGCGSDDDGGSTGGADTGATPASSSGAVDDDGMITGLPQSTGVADSSGGSSAGDESSTAADSTGGTSDGQRRIYLNFGGAEIVRGADDSTADTSSVLSGTFEPFEGGMTSMQEIRATVTAHFEAFDVEIVDQRPAAAPYIMVVVTPTNTTKGETVAIGPLDCNDTNPNDVVFVFTDDDPNPLNVAVRASGRVGSALGVSNSVSNTDLSSTSIAFPGMAQWTDDCIPVDMPPDMCMDAALKYCETADEHNPFQIVLAALGPAR